MGGSFDEDNSDDGGYEMAERKVAGFGSEEMFGYRGAFPISMIKVSPVAEKFGEELNHRDYIGSLMNLGIRRDTKIYLSLLKKIQMMYNEGRYGGGSSFRKGAD